MRTYVFVEKSEKERKPPSARTGHRHRNLNQMVNLMGDEKKKRISNRSSKRVETTGINCQIDKKWAHKSAIRSNYSFVFFEQEKKKVVQGYRRRDRSNTKSAKITKRHQESHCFLVKSPTRHPMDRVAIIQVMHLFSIS